MNQMQVNTHHTWILWDLDAHRQDLQISVFDQNTFSANDPLGSRFFVLSNWCVSRNSGCKKTHLRFEQLIKGGDLSHRATGSSWHRVWGSQSLHWIGNYLDSRRRWTRDSSWVLQSWVMSVLDSWIPSDVSRVRPLPWEGNRVQKLKRFKFLLGLPSILMKHFQLIT